MKTEYHILSIEEEEEILNILAEIRRLLWNEISEEYALDWCGNQIGFITDGENY